MDAKEQAVLTPPSQRDDALREWFGDGEIVDNKGAPGEVAQDAAFARWFRESKVVDANGKPLVVYHGATEDFSAFETDILGAFFTSSPAVADHYSRDTMTMQVYLSLQDPLDVDAKGASWDDIPYAPLLRAAAKRSGFDFDGYEDGTIDADTLAQLARAAGNDGVMIRNLYEPATNACATEYIAFRPEDIKSYTGNSGAYSLATSDIRFSRTASKPLPRVQKALAQWFGDSQIRDEHGAPLVTYHGTAGDFSHFSKKLRGAVTETSDAKLGFWFSISPSRASSAALDAQNMTEDDAGANVMPCYLYMADPYESYESVYETLADPDETAKIIGRARRAGHDGVVFYGGEGGTNFVVFEGNQVKSALGNVEFDSGSADIRFSRASATPLQATVDRRVVITSVPKAVFEQLQEIDWRDAIALVAGKTEKPGGVDPVRQFGTELEAMQRLVLFGRVPLSAFVENEEGDLYDGTVNRERAEAYAKRPPEDVPPVIAVLGRLSGKLNILDGGHRLTAARMRGDATVPVILKLRRDTELVHAERSRADLSDERFPTTSEATSAFRAWLGESKIVQRDGSAQIVYYAGHPGEVGAIAEGKTLSPFKLFAVDRDRLTGQRLVPAYLRILRPLDLSTPDGLSAAHRLYGIFDAHDDVKVLMEKVAEAQESLEYEQSRTARARLQYTRVGADGNVIAVRATPLLGYTAQRFTLAEASAECQDLIEAARDEVAAAELALDRAIRSKRPPQDLRNHFQGGDAGERLRSAGFDGAIFQDAGSTMIAALDPGQISLAHDFSTNNGHAPSDGAERSFGLTVGQVKAALAKDRYAHDVDIYADFEALPPDVKDQARRENNRGVEGFWDTRRNKVALVAEFIGSAERARQVARHELVGHYGLENMLGPREMQRVVSQVIEAENRGNMTIKRFAARVDAVQPGLPPDGRAIELIAMLAEHDVHNGTVRRIADGVRVFLRGIGFLKSDTTDAEVCGLLRDAERYLAQEVATAPGLRTRARVFSRGGRLLADCAATPWHRSLEDGAVYRVLDAKLGPRLIAVQNAEPRAKFAYFGAGGVKQDWQSIDALGDGQRASLTKIGGAREIMVAGPNSWRRRSLLDDIRDTAFLKLVTRRRREGRRWRSAVRASMGDGPAGRAAVARIRDRDFETLRRPVYYGTIKAQPTDRDLLRSFGAELGTYDQALGAFHARVGRDAYQSLQAFSNDFELRLTAVDEAAHADKAIRMGDRSALQQQLARLQWKLNARELAGDVRRGILAEVDTVEQELQLVAPLPTGTAGTPLEHGSEPPL